MQCALPAVLKLHRGPCAPSSLPRGRTCAIMYVACLFFSPVVGGCGHGADTIGQVLRKAGTA
jgi:hypothetical protein